MVELATGDLLLKTGYNELTPILAEEREAYVMKYAIKNN